MMRRLPIIIFVMFLCYPVLGSAQDVPLNDIRFDEAQWDRDLLKILEDGPRILPADEPFEIAPPPLNDSEQTKKELDQLREWSKTERTPNALKRIQFENVGVSALQIFEAEGLFSSKDNPLAAAFITMMDADHRVLILREKKRFMRPRPNQLAPDLELAISNPGHPAYPSGHASQTWMVALVLSQFDPAHKDLYFKVARDIGHRREIAGLHYPSDSEAGRKFAQDVYDRLMENPVVRKRFEKSRASFVKPPDNIEALYNDY